MNTASSLIIRKSTSAIVSVECCSQQNRSFVKYASRSREEARLAVLKLYRTLLKNIPDVKKRYNVPGSEHDMRACVKSDFDKYKNQHLHYTLVDAMVFRGYNDLEEMQKHF